jgi:Mrp family chromosome partitioning ATPase
VHKPLFSRAQNLQSQIEINAPLPAIIMVTSATTDDGSTTAAARLAVTLAASGSSVALLCSSLEHATTGAGERSPISILVLAKELKAVGRSGDAVARLADRMRQDFDYTVVDALPLAQSNVSTRLAPLADAVLIAIRVGRSSCPEDVSMMRALQMAGARVLGVIGTAEATIRGRDGAGEPAALRAKAPGLRPQKGFAAALATVRWRR